MVVQAPSAADFDCAFVQRQRTLQPASHFEQHCRTHFPHWSKLAQLFAVEMAIVVVGKDLAVQIVVVGGLQRVVQISYYWQAGAAAADWHERSIERGHQRPELRVVVVVAGKHLIAPQPVAAIVRIYFQ